MKIIGITGCIILFAFTFTSCLTTTQKTQATTAPKKEMGKPLPQVFSDADALRVAKYNLAEKGLIIDELQTAPAPGATFTIDPNAQAYEGYRILQLFELDKRLSLAEQYTFIKALFSAIPKDTPADGSSIRNIVIPAWYASKKPLVLQVVKLKAGTNPALVVLFNTNDGIRKFGVNITKNLGPMFEIPRILKVDGKSNMEADDYFSLSILEDGRVSASRAVGKEVPAFSTVADPGDKTNLTDDYLRDSTRSNDNLVLPVLETIIAGEANSPIVQVHAHLQLFLYYLLQGNYADAAKVITAVQGSKALADPKAADTEIAGVAKNSLKNILLIAQALSSGNETSINK